MNLLLREKLLFLCSLEKKYFSKNTEDKSWFKIRVLTDDDSYENSATKKFSSKPFTDNFEF